MKLTILILVFVVACGDPARDSSGLACDHFRNVAGDISDGVLTDSEARKKFQEIDSNASIATPAVQAAARELLAAMTSGDSSGVFAAMGKMDAACDATDH